MTRPLAAPAAASTSVTAAYSATGTLWQNGPGPVYDTLAAVLVEHSPHSLQAATVLDVGAGTGAASRAAIRAGAQTVIAIDAATGMLASDVDLRPPAVVGDARRLPLRSACFDVVLAAFSLNHLPDPEAGFVEAARVVRRGGAIVASTYAHDDTHPVKAAVEEALRAQGWTAPQWYTDMRRDAVPRLATIAGCTAAAHAAGLDPTVRHVKVPFPNLEARQLVAWRLGMAQHAPFVRTLTLRERAALQADAIARLGPDPPALVRSILITTAVR